MSHSDGMSSSFSIKCHDYAFRELMGYGRDGRGILCVFAAGNTPGVDVVTYQPAASSSIPLIIAASIIKNLDSGPEAVNYNNMHQAFINNPLSIDEDQAFYSCKGDRIDLCAPSSPDPASYNDFGIFSPITQFSGSIGDENQIIERQIVGIFNNNSWFELDSLEGIMEGQSIEFGEYAENTFIHDVRFIAEIDRSNNKIKLDDPLKYAKEKGSNGSIYSPLNKYVRVTVLRIEVASLTNNIFKLKSMNGIGSVPTASGSDRQKVFIYSIGNISSGVYSEISFANHSTKEIKINTPCSMTGTMIVIPGQMKIEINTNAFGNGYDAATGYNFNGFFKSQLVQVGVGSSKKICHVSSISFTIGFSQRYTGSTAGIKLKSLSYGNYTSAFSGTSAAAPIVSGVAGLMLTANPQFNILEIKHILKSTAYHIAGASYSNPSSNNISHYNHGYNIHPKFGAGRVDAGAAVQLAKDWHSASPTQPILKPNLWIADRMNPDGTVSQSILSSDPDQTVDSPDIWIKKATENTPTIVPTPTLPLNSLNTYDDQKIYIRIRNQGNSDSFKGCDLRVFVAFTDVDENYPAFPFPENWYDKTDVKLLAIQEIPLIAPLGETIIKIDWKDIDDKWNMLNSWNPIDSITGKRKRTYILAHISPFDDLFSMDGDTNFSLQNLRYNKQLTCKELIVTHKVVKKGSASLPGNNFNLTVGDAMVSKDFDLTLENTSAAEFDNLQIKATKTTTDVSNNLVEEEVVFKKVNGNWGLENGNVDWIAFADPTVTDAFHLDYKDLKFPHTITVNDAIDAVKIEVVTV